MADFAAQHTGPEAMPACGICLGEAGRLSRVLNRHFTPVTHDLLPAVAAPGQLSAATIMEERRSLFLPSRQFYILGHPVDKSPSPDMHNAAFKRVGLPWTYSKFDDETIDKFVETALAAPDFGGASVTIPHKQAIMPHLDEISPAASAIGAVNTVVVQEPEPGVRRLYGDNTDWIGIRRPIAALLRDDAACEGVAVVVGAGGTAMAAVYAMQSLDLPVLVFNPRTPSKGHDLAARFAGSDGAATPTAGLDAIDKASVEAACAALGLEAPAVRAVVCTLPASAAFTLPEWMVADDAASKPAVLDVVYKPPLTPLIQQAMETGCGYVLGSKMLLEQGVEQSAIWTSRRAPRADIAAALLANMEGQDGLGVVSEGLAR